MYRVESRNILTPQNGMNIYIGRTEDSMLLNEIRDGDPMDIGAKYDAPSLLAGTLKTRRNKGMILMGNLGDPYNEHEQELGLVRKSLKVIEYFDYGVIINTRRNGILRDMDILENISRKTRCVVEIPLPSLNDEKLGLIDGKDTLTVSERLQLMKTLADAGVIVVASLYPIIPYVNDDPEELMETVERLIPTGVAAIDICDGRVMVRKAIRDFFYQEFRERFPSEYKAFTDELGEPQEFYIRDKAAVLKQLGEAIYGAGLMSDTKQIKLFKRKYENKQTGEQLSLFDTPF